MNETTSLTKGNIISALFLVAGTIVGGGMLALPVATGLSGFIPSSLLMILCWAAMTLTALLYVEVSLWMEPYAHVITMTSKILGPIGKAFAWVLYLFICYASLVGYTAGGSVLMTTALDRAYEIPLDKFEGSVLFLLLFGTSFYIGHHFVGRINSILFIAMVGAYFALVGTGAHEMNFSLLQHSEWKSAFFAVPLLLTSFSFQTMVPSLTPYLKRNKRALQLAIVGGTTLSLIIYLVWQALILGIVPVEGPHGLAKALELGEPATQFISEHVVGAHIGYIAEFFAFFAIVTSFLGIGLGLFDFLADGLKIKEKGFGKFFLVTLILIPTLYFTSQFERVFMIALDSTGGYGDTLLNGVIPVLLVWIGHYSLGYGKEEKSFLTNRFLLFSLFLFYCTVFIYKLLLDFGYFL